MNNKSTLLSAFRAWGLLKGDSVIVHSSFRALLPFDGNPQNVVDALLESIGPSGNLMIPTFNYSLQPSETFDVDGTPCRTGIISETARKHPVAIRSQSPSHSVSVIGPDAEELTKNHLTVRTFGVGSPIDRLAKKGGKVLLLGVTQLGNSTIHVGEEYVGLPKGDYKQPPVVMKVKLPDGSVHQHQRDTSASCSMAFNGLEYFLRRDGHIVDGRVGSYLCYIMKGQDIIDTVVEAVKQKPDVLLCTAPECESCTEIRKNLRERGLMHVRDLKNLPVNRHG